jgi:hypothetical protein
MSSGSNQILRSLHGGLSSWSAFPATATGLDISGSI